MGAAGAAVTGLAGVTTSASAYYRNVVETDEEGDPERGGSYNTMHVEVVDMTPGDRSEAEEAYRGLRAGLSKLYDQNPWFDGYLVKFWDPNYTYDGGPDTEGLENALDEAMLSFPFHYLVVYEGEVIDLWDPLAPHQGSLHAHGSSPIWGKHEQWVSGLSVATSEVSWAPILVRGLHQVIHSYIDRDLAKSWTDEEMSGYDAIHALGTATPDHDYVRSVMADTYWNAVSDGRCAPDSRYVYTNSPETVDDIYFSDCTQSALSITSSRAEAGRYD